jgi:hypothetical protein
MHGTALPVSDVRAVCFVTIADETLRKTLDFYQVDELEKLSEFQ